MPKAKCPQCATIVTYAAGYHPICPTCGFRGEAPVVPAPPPAAWSHVPTPAQGFSSPPPYATAPRAGASGLSVAALVLGILALILGWVPFLGALMGILAAILGGAGLGNRRPDGQPDPGRGMAVAGLVMGAIALAMNFLFWGTVFGWGEGW